MKNLFQKSLLVLIGVLITSLTIPMWGSISFVVGVTGTGSSSSYGGSDYNKMKLNTQFYWTNTEKGWITNTMSKASMTFEGKDLYITSMTYDDAIQTWHMQFQKYKDNYQVYSWDAMSGVAKTGDYWDTYIVAYGGERYGRVSVSSGAKFYFDASNWSQTAIKLVAGHANHQTYYTMASVSGTKLYYLSTSAYSNAMGIGVVGNTSRSGDNNQWLTDVSAHASEYTGWKNYGLTSTGANNAYLMVNTGSSGEEPSMHYNNSYSTLLNSTQTYNTVVKTIGGSYTSANSKSTINISSYELTSQGGTTNRTPTLSTSESSETVSACRTATTRLQVGAPATGYQFDGWYTGATSGSEISDNTDYTYYPTGANTYYARFSEIARTVTVAYKCGSTSIKSAGSVTNVGATTAKNATAPDITGYTFSTWSSMPSGVTTASSLTSTTISINATAADKTITANYTLNSHTLTWDLDGGTVVTAGTCASVGATGTPSGSVNYGASITAPVPEKDGYTFAGWNTTPASTMPDNDLTYTAQWTEITHTVSFANDGNGSTSPSSDQTVGEVTGIAISASNNTGYTFYTWTSSNGGSFASAATTASNTFYPTNGDATLTASFNAKQYDITLDDNGDYDGNGSAKVTYNETSLTNISAPTRDGYEVDYYALYSNGNDKVASPTGELEKGLTGYLSGDGKWIHDDDVTLYTIWKPRSYTITLDRQGGTAGPTSFTVTMNDNNYSPLTVQPTRAGYHFEGYFTEPLGEGTQIFDENGEALANVSGYTTTYSKWINTSDDLELYAYWTEVALTFNGSTDDDWATASNWSPACVPTSGHDVTISAEATISGSAVAKSVTIDEEGTLTIASNGALEVTGAITNSDDAKLVVEPSGALIYSGSTNATVEMSMSTGWHLVALPVAGVSVSSAFAGKGVYTYAWGNTTKAWERRGYYDDLMANEAVLVMGSTGYTFTGALVSTGDGGGSLGYDGAKANGDVNMFGNSLTAPIKVSGMTISGSSDGAVHVFNGSGWTGLVSGDVIPAMQGYAILASSGGGSFSYSYATAVRGATNPNAALYAPKRTPADALDYMSIYVSDNEWKTRIRLCENEQFTDEMDLGYEALHMEGEGFAGELYAQAAEKMNILAVPDLEGTVVGFIKGEATDYTISFEGDGKGYYLNDIEEQQSTLIAEDNTYMFTPSENDATRFIISKTPIKHVATGVDEVNDGVKARKQMINGILYIIRDGRLYDAQGALVK